MHGFRVCVALLVLGAGSMAFAQGTDRLEVPRGLWETELDSDGVLFHVRTRRCGRALCGRVERAKNRKGYDTPSNAVGDKVLWELKPQADGSFLGEYRGPHAEQYLDTQVTVSGREMRLRACNKTICKKLVWQRIR